MTPKEKAKQLYDKYMDLEPDYDWEINGINKSLAKKCALIAVDEAIKVEECFIIAIKNSSINATFNLTFWQEVRDEINKL